MRYQIIRSSDGKTWSHKVVDWKNEDVLEIATWKGLYVFNNEFPSVPTQDELKTIFPNITLEYAYRDRSVTVDPIWYCRLNTLEGEFYDLIYYNSIKKKWQEWFNFDDFIKWVLDQPPQPDFKGAEEDRVEVAKLFESL